MVLYCYKYWGLCIALFERQQIWVWFFFRSGLITPRATEIAYFLFLSLFYLARVLWLISLSKTYSSLAGRNKLMSLISCHLILEKFSGLTFGIDE